MQQHTRRRALALAGLGLTAAAAGCLGDGGSDRDPSGTDEPTDDGRGSVATDTIQLGTRLAQPRWDRDETATGRVVLVDSTERADAVLDLGDLSEDRRSRVATFIDETAFEESLLAVVQSVGPDTCHDEVAVEDVAVEDGELTGSAAVVDTSGPDEACGDAITYPSVLLRATVEGDVPTDATFTLTDGWGDSDAVSASVSDRLGPDPADLSGHVRPSDDPATVPAALSCPDQDFERQQAWADDVPWGEAETDGQETFALRVDSPEAAYDDTVTITLTNVSDQRQSTGNRHKHSLQVETEAGWQSVWGTASDDPLGYTDEALLHYPGDGFEWTFELTEEGVLAGHTHEDRLTVCPELQAGRYRFVFWEPAVAVAFDLTR